MKLRNWKIKTHNVLAFRGLFRIAKALKDSESYSRASGGSGSISRNRKTVVRMQSKL